MSELTLERVVNRDETIGASFDGGGLTLDVGTETELYIPYKGRIQSAVILANTSGSVVVDIYKVTFAAFPPTIIDNITGSTPPTLASAQTSMDTALTGWTTLIEADSTLSFRITSVTGLQRVVVVLKIIKL